MDRSGLCVLVLLTGCVTALEAPHSPSDAAVDTADDAAVDAPERDAATPVHDAGTDATAPLVDAGTDGDAGLAPRTFWTPCDRSEVINCSGGTCYSSQCRAPDVVPDARCSFPSEGDDFGSCTFDCFDEYHEVIDGHLVTGYRLSARLEQACLELGGECAAESADAHAFCVAAN